MTKSYTISSDEEIRKLGVAKSYLVFETAEGLQGIDTDNKNVVWRDEVFWMDIDSEILFTDNQAVVMSYDQIMLVDRQGRKMFVNLEGKHRDNIDLVATCGNYIYVNNGWVLESYDIDVNKMVWSVSVDRGGTEVYCDASEQVAYIANSSFLSSFSNITGELLWKKEMSIDESAYANGVLYTLEEEFKRNKYSITAFDIVARKTIWRQEFGVDLKMYINDLSVFQDVLVMSTQYDGFLAFDITDGSPKWQSSMEDVFYTRPVFLDATLYAKGISKKVYAISLADGKTEGYVWLEPDSSF